MGMRERRMRRVKNAAGRKTVKESKNEGCKNSID